MLPPKTEEDALLLITEMEGYYRKAKLAWEEDDDFYEGNLDDIIELPEGYEKTIPTTARAIVDEAVDNVDPYDMIVEYAPRSFSQKAQADAEEISRFCKNMWLYWRSSTYDIDILRDFIKNLFKNGKGILKVTPDWTLWPALDPSEEQELDKKELAERSKMILQVREQNFPLMVRSIHPSRIMEDPTINSRKLWVIESYDASSREIENRYYEYLPFMDSTSFGPNGSYIVHEIWSASFVDANGKFHQGQHRIFVNYVQVEVEDNPYHELPFVIKYSGLGRETYDGMPDAKATGFFTNQVKSMLKAEIRRVAQFDALMSQAAFPIAFFPDSIEDIEIDISPGAINYVPQEVFEAVDNLFVTVQLPESAYLTSLNMIQQSIERGTTQRAVRGAGVPGTDSAAQLQMITAQAKLRLEPVKRATEEAVDMVNRLVLNFIENIFEEPVSVFGAEAKGPDRYTVKPAQIKGKYRTRTTFMPSEEQTKERRLMVSSEAMSKAGMNPYDAYKFAGFDNPQELADRNVAYSILQEPAVKKAMAKKFMEDMGLDVTALVLEDAIESMQQTGMLQALQQQMAMAGQPMQQQGSQFQQGFETQGGGSGQSGAAPPQAIGAPVGGTNANSGADQMAAMRNGAGIG